jgi:DNA-binding MarR family transcriptional regulator
LTVELISYIVNIMIKDPNNLTPEDFAEAIGLIMKRIRSDAPAGMKDFTWTQKAVLKHLENGPATSAELARLEQVKPQSMATVIAFLEEKGLILRKPHPTDGRRVNISLSPKGKSFREKVRKAKSTWLSRTFEQLSHEEQQTILKATEIIHRIISAEE